MNIETQRKLAIFSAEDGKLEEAEETLTRLLHVLNIKYPNTKEAPSGSHATRCRVLMDRASVRHWIVKPSAALDDLAEIDDLLKYLQPLDRKLIEVSVLDLKARILSSPVFGSKFDTGQAEKEIKKLRSLSLPDQFTWIPDATELDLAVHLEDWHRVGEIARRLAAALAAFGHLRGVHAVNMKLAKAEIQMNNREAAKKAAGDACDFFSTEGPPDLAAQARMLQARARGGADQWIEVQQALSTAEGMIRMQRSLLQRQKYLAAKFYLYDEAMNWAIECIHNAPTRQEKDVAVFRAWSIAERVKGFSLRQAIIDGGFLDVLDKDLSEKLNRLDLQLDNCERNQTSSDSLFEERNALISAALMSKSRASLLYKEQNVDIKNCLQNLPDKTGVVSWYWLKFNNNWQLNIFFTDASKNPEWIAVNFSGLNVESIFNDISRFYDNNKNFCKYAFDRNISSLLFPSFMQSKLANCDTLLLVPHRFIQRLSLHTIGIDSDDGESLSVFDRWATQVIPTLLLIHGDYLGIDAKNASQKVCNVLLSGCASDAFQNHILADVPDELDLLAILWKDNELSVECHNLAQTESLLEQVPLDRWQDFDIIHLACHGKFNPSSPLDSALYLGRDAVRAHELFGIKLNAKVVCLSACDVGQHSNHSELDGVLICDEWLGLLFPLLQAGAGSILSSLWEADSKCAVEFMKIFHQELAKGKSVPVAHQVTCITLKLKQDFPICCWANWQLSGMKLH